MDPTKTQTTTETPAPTAPAAPVTPAPAAPASETPSFMQGIVDPTEQQMKARDVLGSAEGVTEGEETPTPGTETPAPGTETPEPGTETPTPGTETPAPGTETPKPGTETPAAPAAPAPGTETPAKTPAQEAEEHKNEMATRAIDRSIQTKEIDQHIQNLVSKPLIKVDAPNPEIYKDKDGTFDIQGYVQDYISKVVVELQKSIAGGNLGAIQFGVLKRAMQQEGEERVNAIKADENAKSIWDKLTVKFPILKKDDAVADRFERSVYGEKARRANKAKAEGKEYVDLVYEDYEKLAADVLGSGASPAPTAPAPTEAMPGSPQLGGGSTRGKDPVGDDIDDMMALKNKKGVLF